MTDPTLLTVLIVFVAVAAASMVFQACVLLGIYKSARALSDNVQRLMPKVEALMPKLETLVESSRVTLEESRRHFTEISTRTNDILDITRRQLGRLDETLEDATARARIQMDRAEMVLDDTMSRAQDTVAMVHKGILKPLKEVQGVTAGLRAAFFFLMRGARPNPAQATADEEMFI